MGTITAKKRIKRFAHSIKAFFKFNKEIVRYSTFIRKNRHNRGLTENSRLVFVINFPESWNSVKSIYYEALKSSNVSVCILAVPMLGTDYEQSASIRDLKNDAYDFFLQEGIEAIKANEESDWYDLRGLNPQNVIYTRPYNKNYPEAYRPYNVCQYAKTFYIPYAYSMLGDNFVFSLLPEDFILSTHKVFLANESRRKLCAEKYPILIKENRNRFEYAGFPRFDLYADDKEDSENTAFTIAWMPRWTTAENLERNKGSHFLEYKDDFLRYAKENPSFEFIIRPHPKMFDHYIAKGIMTEEEVDNFLEACNQLGNISIDNRKDYIGTIKKANVLVADYTSLIAEFFITEKPIVFCDTADNLNVEGEQICNSLYSANSFEEIESIIEKLERGEDSRYNIRKRVIGELLPTERGSIGKTILRQILES